MFQATQLKERITLAESISIYVWKPRKPGCRLIISFGAMPAGTEIQLRMPEWKRLVRNLKRSAWPTKLIRGQLRIPIIVLPPGKVNWRICKPSNISSSYVRDLALSSTGAIVSGAISIEIDRDFFHSFQAACINASKSLLTAKEVSSGKGTRRMQDVSHAQLVFAGKRYSWDAGISTLIFNAFRVALIKKPAGFNKLSEI